LSEKYEESQANSAFLLLRWASNFGAELQIPVPKTQSAYHQRAQRNAFGCPDARQQSRSFAPFESMAETQPQLHPVSLRLSAMISQ
jgi:hypothetical protein